MTRVCITGGPKTGKTTLARDMVGGDDERDRREHAHVMVLHTDDVMHLGWSESSQYVADEWLTQPVPWIVEGVAVPRALRKWLAAHPDGRPCDVVYLLPSPHTELTPAQERMAKGVETVMAEISPELQRRGVALSSSIELVELRPAAGGHSDPVPSLSGAATMARIWAAMRSAQATAEHELLSAVRNGLGKDDVVDRVVAAWEQRLRSEMRSDRGSQ